MARTRGFDDGRFTLLAPSTPRMMIGAHVGGIAKEDLGFFALRQGFMALGTSITDWRGSSHGLAAMRNCGPVFVGSGSFSTGTSSRSCHVGFASESRNKIRVLKLLRQAVAVDGVAGRVMQAPKQEPPSLTP
jgi:hypothetical protein